MHTRGGFDRAHRRQRGGSLHGLHAHGDVQSDGDEEIDGCAKRGVSGDVEGVDGLI